MHPLTFQYGVQSLGDRLLTSTEVHVIGQLHRGARHCRIGTPHATTEVLCLLHSRGTAIALLLQKAFLSEKPGSWQTSSINLHAGVC